VVGISHSPLIAVFPGAPVEWRGVRESDPVCPRIRILADPLGDFAFIVRDDDPTLHPLLAFRVADTQAVNFSAPMVAGRLSPPLGWTIGTLGAVMCALPLLVLARRIRRRADSLVGREGQHLGGGRVAFDGSSEGENIPLATQLPLGPVVLFGETKRVPSYRHAPGADYRGVSAGTMESLRSAFLDRAATMNAIALAALVLGTTPLLVARIYGM
jgi:hypothetical protein